MVLLGAAVWLLVPAEAFARALVRFVHGVPGVGAATVSLHDGTVAVRAGTIAFGQSTHWRAIRSGSFRWTLSGQGKVLAHGTTTVGDGAYDILVLPQAGHVVLHVYRARADRGHASLVRVIHGAPEFGSPRLAVDGRTAVRSLAYAHATPYLPLAPGRHTLAAMAGASATPSLATHADVRAYTSYSEVVLGTRGQRVRVVTLVDRGAPLVRPSGRAARLRRSPGVAAVRDDGTVMVHAGDSLWGIARRLVGPSASEAAVQRRLVEIWDENAHRIGTGDPNLIFPGTRLKI